MKILHIDPFAHSYDEAQERIARMGEEFSQSHENYVEFFIENEGEHFSLCFTENRKAGVVDGEPNLTVEQFETLQSKSKLWYDLMNGHRDDYEKIIEETLH